MNFYGHILLYSKLYLKWNGFLNLPDTQYWGVNKNKYFTNLFSMCTYTTYPWFFSLLFFLSHILCVLAVNQSEKKKCVCILQFGPQTWLVRGMVCISWGGGEGGVHGGLIVSGLISKSSSPGSSPGRGHCVVLLDKTLYSQSASLHLGV